jgi:uridine kinase
VAQRLRRPVLRASIDNWHNPRETRLRRGAESPEGYYLDSFNLPALLAECLLPFNTGVGRIRTAAFDHRTDDPRNREEDVELRAALVVDGVFLLRPELRDLWNLAVYLHVPQEVTLARALQRDHDLFGGEEEVRRRYSRRYLPGQALYRQTANPVSHAHVVIDNSDLSRPVVVRWGDGW